MIDTFTVTLVVPAQDTLFRDGIMVTLTPTGSVERELIPAKTWRDLDNEHSIRTYIEARLINMFPGRINKWHGSIVRFYYEGAGITAVITVDSDHYDGAGLTEPSQFSSFTDD